jgi:hypothetical protein
MGEARRLRRRALAAALLWLGVAAAPVSPAFAADDLGEVVILDEQGEVFSNGASATAFALRLPADATCPGDSMHDQWRVQSFVVPTGVDIGSLKYGVIGPEGEHQWALFGVDTRPIAQRLTPPNATAGQPAQLGAFGLLSFGVLSPGMLPGGTYRLGIACTLFGETAHYWDTEIVVEDRSADLPAGFTWRLPESPSYVAPEPSFPWMRTAGAVLLVLGPLLALFLIRRSRSVPNTPVSNSRKESS